MSTNWFLRNWTLDPGLKWALVSNLYLHKGSGRATWVHFWQCNRKQWPIERQSQGPKKIIALPKTHNKFPQYKVHLEWKLFYETVILLRSSNMIIWAGMTRSWLCWWFGKFGQSWLRQFGCMCRWTTAQLADQKNGIAMAAFWGPQKGSLLLAKRMCNVSKSALGAGRDQCFSWYPVCNLEWPSWLGRTELIFGTSFRIRIRILLFGRTRSQLDL
jgi:hypothetical protein